MPGPVDGAFVGCAGGGLVVGGRAATAAWEGGRPGFDGRRGVGSRWRSVEPVQMW